MWGRGALNRLLQLVSGPSFNRFISGLPRFFKGRLYFGALLCSRRMEYPALGHPGTRSIEPISPSPPTQRNSDNTLIA